MNTPRVVVAGELVGAWVWMSDSPRHRRRSVLTSFLRYKKKALAPPMTCSTSKDGPQTQHRWLRHGASVSSAIERAHGAVCTPLGPAMSDDERSVSGNGRAESAGSVGSAGSAGSDVDDGWRRVQRARSLDPSEQEGVDAASSAARFARVEGSTFVLDMFDDHCNHLQRMASARQALLGLQLVTRQDDSRAADSAVAGECVSFVRLSSDRFVGDARLRCVRALLAEVDERGVRVPLSAHTDIQTYTHALWGSCSVPLDCMRPVNA